MDQLGETIEITPASVRERAKEKLRRDLGEDALNHLADPRTVEMMLNADGVLWLERLGEPMVRIGTIPPHRAEAIVKDVAGYHGKEIRRSSPMLEAELPIDGSRFAAQMPPVVSAPTFAIRKRAVAIFTLQQYVENGIMTAGQCSQLEDAIRTHRNILVIGGTGSGKTTLVNAIIHGMVENDPSERLVIIEDTGEIQCAAHNFIQFHSTAEISMTALLKGTLRMRPDRILVGEVRGPEALDLLMAWNTGHEGGAATLHANDAAAGLTRLSTLINMHADSPDPIERDRMIGEAVHLIVHIARTPEGRRVESLLEVGGYDDGRYGFQRETVVNSQRKLG
jgi:P-type conjugative transfer ATPase TrbB